mmetsp:Transcript_50573/g.54693  ORF Transcript_50573/g.54693 Transcript_50573/m.54693 type:complete len:457 (+) Transcript_50573:112-1482(+)
MKLLFGNLLSPILGFIFLLQNYRATAFLLPSNIRLETNVFVNNPEHGIYRRYLIRQFAVANDDDDEEEDEEEEYDDRGPLAKGIDSVSWLPSVEGAKGSNMPIETTKQGSEILPLFPLGGFVYTPNTEHVLNIFEPRYRQLYTDILMNGSKRFVVVTSHPTEKGRFAKTGVLFALEDLKEVSEKTQDQIKYICNHKVTGRVTIDKILNPEAWETGDTYLKVEGTIHDDSGKDDPGDTRQESDDVYEAVVAAATKKMENDLRTTFGKIFDLQQELEEAVRFTEVASNTLAVKDGPDEDGLWQTIRLWQSFVEQRLMARQNELQLEFQDKLKDFLKEEKGLKNNELPSAIGFSDLTPELQQELQELQKRIAIELQPLVLESSLTMQKIIEAEDHKARCKLLKYFMQTEVNRLTTKKTLQGLFSSDDDTGALSDQNLKASTETEEKKSSGFFDEPDAFQ